MSQPVFTPRPIFTSKPIFTQALMIWLLFFGMQINMEVFYKLTLTFWVCLARQVQSTQNKEVFAIPQEKCEE